MEREEVCQLKHKMNQKMVFAKSAVQSVRIECFDKEQENNMMVVFILMGLVILVIAGVVVVAGMACRGRGQLWDGVVEV